jgi:hypothetical protein
MGKSNKTIKGDSNNTRFMRPHAFVGLSGE